MKQKICKKLSMFCYDEETAAWKRLVFSHFIRRVKHKNIDIFMTYSCFDKGCLTKV